MNKKVILSLASMVSISSIVVAHLFAKHSSNFSTIFAESGTWYHYPAVEPTESCHGSLEF